MLYLIVFAAKRMVKGALPLTSFALAKKRTVVIFNAP